MFQKLLISVFFLPQFLLSQEKNVESLFTVYEDKAWYAIVEEKDSGIYYSNKIIELSRKKKESFKEILGYEYRGIYNEEVLNDYEAAVNDYLSAIKIAEKNRPDYIPDLYVQLGILFFRIEKYSNALKYLQDAVHKTEVNSDTYIAAIINLSYTQNALKKYDEANKNFIKSLSITNLSKDQKQAALLGLGKNLIQQQKYNEAQEYYLQAIKLEEGENFESYWENYLDFIDNAVRLNDIDNLKKYLKKIEIFFSKVGSEKKKLGFYERMVNTYKLFKNYKLATVYQDSIISTKETLANKVYDKNLIELETKYQTKKKEELIIEEQSKKQLWTYISIFVFVVLIIVAILLYKNNQKRKLLNTNKIELEKLLNQRNMLLRETHHRVKNSFQMVSSLLQLQAQDSKAEAAVSALNLAVERVNSMIVLHQQLYAKDNLLGVDLQVYINDLINEILTSYSSEDIKINSTIKQTILDIDTATSIGLLVNELATNSIKYAWAANTSEKIITLDIDIKDDIFYFKMFDNGTSKKTKTTEQNYGSELIEILIERLDAKRKPLTTNDFGLYLEFNKVV